jgi:hypothetical protein
MWLRKTPANDVRQLAKKSLCASHAWSAHQFAIIRARSRSK